MRYIFRNTDSHDKIVKYDITYVGYDDLTTKRYVKLINSDTNKIHSLNHDELHSYYKGLHKFYKCDRSTFSYWFAHWCAFQLTALNLRRWKFKYLFHDFENLG